ncbi:hypothetical protein [Marinobacter caseinilyticus]|uniref:hypothetical protein n=1 Tax=Marinobacter caseinilyticus TaxID=2692195 RepID=UPI00140D543C|nr:hypothetical protein [Marinobacter caseinilyticus]
MSVDVPLDNIRIKQFPNTGAGQGIEFAGGIDFDLDEIRIRELAPISIGVTELPAINIGVTNLPDVNVIVSLSVDNLPTIALDSDSRLNTDSTVKTDNKVDLDLDVRIRELPQLDVQLGLRPMRFHFPLNYRFRLTLFGIKVFEFETCGEGMIVAEDYQAKSAEQCE